MLSRLFSKIPGAKGRKTTQTLAIQLVAAPEQVSDVKQTENPQKQLIEKQFEVEAKNLMSELRAVLRDEPRPATLKEHYDEEKAKEEFNRSMVRRLEMGEHFLPALCNDKYKDLPFLFDKFCQGYLRRAITSDDPEISLMINDVWNKQVDRLYEDTIQEVDNYKRELAKQNSSEVGPRVF